MNISTQFLDKYNKQGPRYTSYPPATAFLTNFSNNDFVEAVLRSNEEQPENISIYVHIPFCPQRCFFCGCNTTAFENDEKVSRYIECLKKEIRTVAKHIKKNRAVTQIHWGGGTPNSIKFSFVEDVMNCIKSELKLADNCEVAMECSPAYLELEEIDTLVRIGFNRISLGIQDFSADVLKAINRKAPKHPIESIFARLKQNNFKGVNIDLVYGLPLQSVESFKKNIETALSLSPDRLVTFSYAHVPWFNEEQKKMEGLYFPTPEEKMTMLVDTINTMSANGYETIGMDHFAKPSDELAIAKTNKTLHRNFQGYCTKASTGQVYAFGASSISQLGSAYSQNIKQINRYIAAIEADGLAIERGYSLSKEERIIRDVINEVMCNGVLDFAEIAKSYDLTITELKAILSYNPDKLAEFIEDNLVEITETTVKVNSLGMMVVRNIAMTFDPNLDTEKNHFSKTV